MGPFFRKIAMKSWKNCNSLSVSFSFKFLIILLNENSLEQNFLIFREFSGGVKNNF